MHKALRMRMMPHEHTAHVGMYATCMSPTSTAQACHVFADRLDLPNASRTNKTFTSGLVRGARREASTAIALGQATGDV